MAILYSNGSQSDVIAKIASASAGDIVDVPAGSFTWGSGSSQISVNKAITLAGQGAGVTIINIATDAPHWSSGTISVTAAATISGFTINQAGSQNTTAISTGTANDWRVTEITYNSAATVGYFVYAGSYGLIDSCAVNAVGGTDEPIFVQGPSDSWQTPNSLGTANAVFIEDCTFSGSGYICDFNSNSRGVVRFCTITAQNKADSHGLASNSPARGVRHTEVYNNHWTAAAGFWTAIEIRGGTGMVFDNICDNLQIPAVPQLKLDEYGCYNQWPNFGSVYQTPWDYPIADQVGVGQDPKAAHSEPMYVWSNLLGGADWTISAPAPASGAITLYQSQTGNPSATFDILTDIIVADRDYFKQTVGATFDGTSGVGRGTTAQMNAITPTLVGAGFLVTDQGSWRTGFSGTSGVLYKWSGSAWVQAYTPYSYPHPLRGSTFAPVITLSPQSQTVSAGANVTFTASAIGNPSPTWQWYKNGVAISGATNSILTLNSVGSENEAIYTAIATNSEGSDTSLGATLIVSADAQQAPVITVEPQSQTVVPGVNVTFTTSATGVPAPTYQWYKNGAIIVGATSPILSLTSVTSSSAAVYTVTARNALGSDTSIGATLTVTATPAPPKPTHGKKKNNPCCDVFVEPDSRDQGCCFSLRTKLKRGTVPTPTVYFANVAQTATNLCPEGSAGSPISVTVAANSVYSHTSFADANAQALTQATSEAAALREASPCFYVNQEQTAYNICPDGPCEDAALSCRTRGGVATLCGFSEYTDPSTPPKKYKLQTWAGERHYSCNGGTIQNSSATQTIEYSATTCATTTSGTPPGFCSSPTSTTTTQTTIYDEATGVTTGAGLCCAFGDSMWQNSFRTKTLTEESTEEEAIARLFAGVAGTWSAWRTVDLECFNPACCTAYYEQRTAFTFSYQEAQYEVNQNGLTPGVRYEAYITVNRRAYGDSTWLPYTTIVSDPVEADGAGNVSFSGDVPNDVGFETYAVSACVKISSHGDPISVTIPSGTVQSFVSVADANAIALNMAQSEADELRESDPC